MDNDNLQLAKNFGFHFRYVLILLGVGVVAAVLLGTVWFSKKLQNEAKERQAAEISRIEAAEKARQLAEEQQRQAEQQRIDEQTRLQAEEIRRQRQVEQQRIDEQARVQAAEIRRQEAETKRREDAERSRQLAENQRREYIARYLRSTNSLKSSEKASIAIGVANHKRQLDEAFAAQVSALFAPASVKASSALFTPASAADGVLQRILQSDAGEISRLGLASLADHLLLGSYRVEFSTNGELQSVITARLRFDGGVIRSESGALLESLSFDASGAGFVNDQAEAAAKERLLKSLAARKWLFLEK